VTTATKGSVPDPPNLALVRPARSGPAAGGCSGPARGGNYLSDAPLRTIAADTPEAVAAAVRMAVNHGDKED
jgi:hypothetical protein